jgi:glycosyltransferase involved in cell wall biosynthesis
MPELRPFPMILENVLNMYSSTPPSDYSVVISSSGRKQYLIELLESIYSQSCPPAEVIILLDDNSIGKECITAISKLESKPAPRFELCKNLNLPAKRNAGAHFSSHDIILYSDDDDLWAPVKSEVILSIFRRGYSCICHNFSCFGSELMSHCNGLGVQSRTLSRLQLLCGDNIYGGGSTISASRNLVLAIPFNETLSSCEDLDWWRRVQLSGNTIFYCGQDLVSYRRHANNMGKNRQLMSYTQFRVAFDGLLWGLVLSIGSCVMLIKALIRFLR